MPTWFVYILKSLSSDFIYVGSTNNLKKRLTEHNHGLVQSTKHYYPFELMLYVAVKSEKKARELEHYLSFQPPFDPCNLIAELFIIRISAFHLRMRHFKK